MRNEKVSTPQVKGVKNFLKQTTKQYKGQFLNTQKNSYILLYCY